MKIVLLAIALLGWRSFAFGQVVSNSVPNPFGVSVTNADAIAILTVEPAARISATNEQGRVLEMRVADARVERVIKGKLPATFRIRDAGASAHFPVPQTERTANGIHVSGTSRWLALLKKSGDYYVAASDYGLCSMYGEGPHARVLMPSCLSLEEVEAMIGKYLGPK